MNPKYQVKYVEDLDTPFSRAVLTREQFAKLLRILRRVSEPIHISRGKGATLRQPFTRYYRFRRNGKPYLVTLHKLMR